MDRSVHQHNRRISDAVRCGVAYDGLRRNKEIIFEINEDLTHSDVYVSQETNAGETAFLFR